MTRVIGRLDDLERRARRADEQRLADALVRWSLDGNREWLTDGVRREEAFLQVSVAQENSVLAWEVAQLQADGYVGVGPFWVPARWFRDPESYRRVVRLVADHVLAQPRAGESIYVAKARGELEPLLAMWPFVLVLPTTAAWSLENLIRARAWPVHPLGVVSAPTHADGRVCAPAEFFFHDVDHARFKVREDLLARGVTIPDPYRHGGTFDAERGEHRCVLAAAVPHVDESHWGCSAERAARVDGWLAAIAAEPKAQRGREGGRQEPEEPETMDSLSGSEPARDLGEAARWLLFELVHEKSLPIDVPTLVGALASDQHVTKLRRKCASGFFATAEPAPAVVARLDDARDWLRGRMDASP